MDVDVLMSPTRREAGGQQCVLHPIHFGYVNSIAIQERSRALLGRKHLVASWIGDHAGD